MIPAPFAYVRAADLDDAFAALADPEAKVIAGGHSLLPMMKLRLAVPRMLVDIGHLSFRGVDASGAVVRVGALTTWEMLLHADPRISLPTALVQAAGAVGDLQVRNAGTIGGALAHGDPACDVAAPLLALGAQLEIAGPEGTRRRPLEGFFTGPFSTELGRQELLTQIVVGERQPNVGTAYVAEEDAASGYPVVGVAVMLRLEAGRVVEERYGVTGTATTMPFLARSADEVVAGLTETREDADYLRHLAGVVTSRARHEAASEAIGGDQ